MERRLHGRVAPPLVYQRHCSVDEYALPRDRVSREPHRIWSGVLIEEATPPRDLFSDDVLGEDSFDEVVPWRHCEVVVFLEDARLAILRWATKDSEPLSLPTIRRYVTLSD